MAVDVIIVNWNGGRELVAAVRSARRFGGRPIVVDNASTAGSLAEVEAMPGVTVIHESANRGFAAGCNRGAAAGRAELLLMLNPDAEILAGTSSDLAAAFTASGATLIGARLEDGTGRPVASIRSLPRTSDLLADLLRLRAMAARITRRPPRTGDPPVTGAAAGWIVGSALAMRRTDWVALGGMDAGFFLWHEDIDLGARVSRRGGSLAVAPAVVVRHTGAQSWRRMSRRRRQWLRVRGAYRYARRHLGRRSAAMVLLGAPVAMTMGVALDVAHRSGRPGRSLGADEESATVLDRQPHGSRQAIEREERPG